MDTESENLRVGIGINQSSNKIGNLKIGGWRESIPELTLENLFSRIDAKLSTLFEDHPLLKTKLKTEEMKSESWRSLTKLLSRGYTLGSDHGSSRVIKLNTNGELSIFSNESKENIHNLDSLRWSFNP